MNKKLDKKLDKKCRENALKNINKLTKTNKTITQKNKSIRKKIIKKELINDKKTSKSNDKKTSKSNDKKTSKSKDKKIVKKKDNKNNNQFTTNMSKRLPLIKNQSGGLGGIGGALFNFFNSVPAVFTNFGDLASNMGKEFSSLQRLPEQIKNGAQTQPGQPLAKI